MLAEPIISGLIAKLAFRTSQARRAQSTHPDLQVPLGLEHGVYSYRLPANTFLKAREPMWTFFYTMSSNTLFRLNAVSDVNNLNIN